MRISRDEIHPVIWEVVDRYTQEMVWQGGTGSTPSQVQAISKHQRIWMKEYGAGCAAWACGLVAMVISAVSLVPHEMKKWAALVTIVIALGTCLMLYRRNLRQITDEELSTLTPVLQLSPVQSAYVEAMVVLKQLKLPSETERDLVAQLNGLLDEEARLMQIRERGAQSPATTDEVTEELANIRGRLESTTDPVSREVLERSLDMCEKRLASNLDLSVVVQRVDAQLTLIEQSMRGMRDTLRRLHSAPVAATPEINLAPIRQTIEQAQYHAAALESAVDEVQRIGTL